MAALFVGAKAADSSSDSRVRPGHVGSALQAERAVSPSEGHGVPAGEREAQGDGVDDHALHRDNNRAVGGVAKVVRGGVAQGGGANIIGGGREQDVGVVAVNSDGAIRGRDRSHGQCPRICIG